MLFDKNDIILFNVNISALEMASPGNRHCADCIGTLSFPVKGNLYSIAARRVPGLIPVLGSQPAGDVSHKPGDRLP